MRTNANWFSSHPKMPRIWIPASYFFNLIRSKLTRKQKHGNIYRALHIWTKANMYNLVQKIREGNWSTIYRWKIAENIFQLTEVSACRQLHDFIKWLLMKTNTHHKIVGISSEHVYQFSFMETTQGRRNRGGRGGLCPPTSFVGGAWISFGPPHFQQDLNEITY